MDDSTRAKKSPPLLCLLLFTGRFRSHGLRIDQRVRAFYLMLLIFLSPFYGAMLFAQACDSTSAPKVECRTYYGSNQIESIHKWRNAQRHGLWVDFKENGLFKRRIRYRNGRLIWQMDYISEKEVIITNKNGDTKSRKSCGCR